MALLNRRPRRRIQFLEKTEAPGAPFRLRTALSRDRTKGERSHHRSRHDQRNQTRDEPAERPPQPQSEDAEGTARSSRNAVRHGPSRPAGLDSILTGLVAALAAPRQMLGCSGSPWPSRVHAENHFPGFPQTKPISANEANGEKLVKTTFEDELVELKGEQRRIMRLFGHTSRDDF
jgi:hypothetical protein